MYWYCYVPSNFIVISMYSFTFWCNKLFLYETLMLYKTKQNLQWCIFIVFMPGLPVGSYKKYGQCNAPNKLGKSQKLIFWCKKRGFPWFRGRLASLFIQNFHCREANLMAGRGGKDRSRVGLLGEGVQSEPATIVKPRNSTL